MLEGTLLSLEGLMWFGPEEFIKQLSFGYMALVKWDQGDDECVILNCDDFLEDKFDINCRIWKDLEAWYFPSSVCWSQFLESLPLPNIKWILPTAPTRPVALFGGLSSTAWFNVEDMSDNATDDVEGLDASATHIANMLSNERDDSYEAIWKVLDGVACLTRRNIYGSKPQYIVFNAVKLGVAGFSMGAAMALYSATCRVFGQYGNGNRFPINLSVAVALSGWLPCSRIVKSRVDASQEAARRAASLPILVCHGLVDDVVEHKHGEKSAQTLLSAGFQNLAFCTYNGLGHYTTPEEMNDVCRWLVTMMRLG